AAAIRPGHARGPEPGALAAAAVNVFGVLSTSLSVKVPLAVGVPAVPLPTPPASTTEPVAVPEITAASLVPLIVIVTTLAVPSTVVTVNVSVVLWPLFKIGRAHV